MSADQEGEVEEGRGRVMDEERKEDGVRGKGGGGAD